MTVLFDPFRELDTLTDALFDRHGANAMPVDLYRERDHYVLNADLPGFDPRSLDVSVEDQLLTIRAERSVAGPTGAQWLANERPSVAFLRQFAVGDGIDADRVEASFTDGVLRLTIPVSERAKPRKITVDVSHRPREVGRSGTGMGAQERDGAAREGTLKKVAKKLLPLRE